MTVILVTNDLGEEKHFENVKECYRDDSGNLIVEYKVDEGIKREKVIDGCVKRFSTRFIVSGE